MNQMKRCQKYSLWQQTVRSNAPKDKLNLNASEESDYKKVTNRICPSVSIEIYHTLWNIYIMTTQDNKEAMKPCRKLQKQKTGLVGQFKKRKLEN